MELSPQEADADREREDSYEEETQADINAFEIFEKCPKPFSMPGQEAEAKNNLAKIRPPGILISIGAYLQMQGAYLEVYPTGIVNVVVGVGHGKMSITSIDPRVSSALRKAIRDVMKKEIKV